MDSQSVIFRSLFADLFNQIGQFWKVFIFYFKKET